MSEGVTTGLENKCAYYGTNKAPYFWTKEHPFFENQGGLAPLFLMTWIQPWIKKKIKCIYLWWLVIIAVKCYPGNLKKDFRPPYTHTSFDKQIQYWPPF